MNSRCRLNISTNKGCSMDVSISQTQQVYKSWFVIMCARNRIEKKTMKTERGREREREGERERELYIQSVHIYHLTYILAYT